MMDGQGFRNTSRKILTPFTGLAPNVSGKTPSLRRTLWQFGAKWMAAPVSLARRDRSNSCPSVSQPLSFCQPGKAALTVTWWPCWRKPSAAVNPPMPEIANVSASRIKGGMDVRVFVNTYPHPRSTPARGGDPKCLPWWRVAGVSVAALE